MQNWSQIFNKLLGHALGRVKQKTVNSEQFCVSSAALQVRVGQRSITANLWPLTTHIYHIMIIVTIGFSKKSFLTILNLFSCDLNTFTKHTEQVCFLFICSFFICCFIIILCINALHLFILFYCM